MRFTIRLKDDDYVDLEFDYRRGELYIHSPLPNLTRKQLTKLATTLGWKIHLKITDEIYLPYYYIDNDDSNFNRLLTVCKALSWVISNK